MKEKEKKRERELGIMKGTVSFWVLFRLWFALFLSLSPSLTICRLETSYLTIFYEKKVWTIPGERGREKSGKLASAERKRTDQRERGESRNYERNRMNSSRCLLLWIKSSRSAKSFVKTSRNSFIFLPILHSLLFSPLSLSRNFIVVKMK